MGVSGSGKSTLAALLQKNLGCPMLEGDSFHPAHNIEKMKAGTPLSDDDRRPWLDQLGGAARIALETRDIAIISCSALKRSYRDRLRAAVDAPLSIVLLTADFSELTRRIQSRRDHYMPVSLLESQIEALEFPDADENALVLEAYLPPEALHNAIIDWLGLSAVSTVP
jgi:gluconokinase